jgi:hypothetical protein
MKPVTSVRGRLPVGDLQMNFDWIRIHSSAEVYVAGEIERGKKQKLDPDRMIIWPGGGGGSPTLVLYS